MAISNRGWILAFRSSSDKPAQYWLFKTKGMALSEADRLKSKGWEIVNIYQSPKDVTIYTKEVM